MPISRRTAANLLTALCAAGLPAVLAAPALGQQKLHFTYLWHMEQPIYWPDRQPASFGADRYENAWVSIQRKDGGAANPANNLRDIFSVADRVASYQNRMADSLYNFSLGRNEAGVQITYSGGLIENIRSLGNANQLGYTANWNSSIRTARTWTTLNAPVVPRMDVVLFPYHHALMPLLETSTQRKQIQAYKAVYADAWGGSVPMSQGFFPSEMAFSERMIPALAAEGVQWSIVSAEKVSRACADFPFVQGSGGCNMDPPNRADQQNPAQGTANYNRQSIDRGCSPAEAFPYALTPRRARYVDPATGAVSSIIVVPASQSLGWRDGYSPMGIGDFNTLQTRNDGSRPMLIVLAHDGDNAWGGGYSYYMEAVPNFVSTAVANGYVPTVVQRYLADHPVPANDWAKVEDGAWVNADGDFGAPQFLNWNWPPVNSQGKVDIENGWAEDIRNWSIINAMQNRVDTAERIWLAQGNAVNPRNIVYPETAGTSAVERAWHYFMGGLNSGYMYYGTALDMEVKPTVACNNAARLVDPIISGAPASGPLSDLTGPTVWAPQRHPWNPGSTNFGPQYQYRSWKSNGDFYVWSFVYDVSGTASVTLKYRTDNDGVMSITDTDNRTYAGGPAVGPWHSVPMTRRVFPTNNVFNDPGINFFVTPTYGSEQVFARINGIRNALVDYYIEAVDTKGNITRSPIEHVYVGDGVGGLTPTPDSGYGGTPTGGGGGGGTSPVVTVLPASPIAGQAVTITYNPAGRALAGASPVRIHYGFNGWQGVPAADPVMSANTDGTWSYTISLPSSACSVQYVFNNGGATWDNNGGADWSTVVSGCVTPPPPPAPWSLATGAPDSRSTVVASGAGGRELRAGVLNNVLYVAAPNAQTTSGGQDAFIYIAGDAQGGGPGPLRAAQWAKSGQVASWTAFLAAESSNTYSGWFNSTGAGTTGAAYQSARGASGSGLLVGTIDLATLFGGAANIPDRVYLAYATFATADGGGLLASSQLPGSVNANTTLDGSEFIGVQLCAINITPGAPTCCPADLAGGGINGRAPDGVVDGTDFVAFINSFAIGDLGVDGLADLNADGTIDGSDFVAFINAFALGC